MSSAGRARFDVLRILRTLSTDGVEQPATSPRKSPRTPRNPDVLTSDDILQEKYQELGELLVAQHVERKALSVLETVVLGPKNKRKGKSSSRSPRKEKKDGSRRKGRPSSARSSQYESSCFYDSDNTDFTGVSGTSSAKRVSFADDVMSFSGESSVVITEITDDDRELEERIKRRPRVSLEEEEAEVQLIDSEDKRDAENELLRSILRSPRPESRRDYRSTSRSRSTTPTTPRRQSAKQTVPSEGRAKDKKQLSNLQTEKTHSVETANGIDLTNLDTNDLDNCDNGKTRRPKKSRKHSPRKGSSRPTTPRTKSNSPRKTNRPSTTSKKGGGNVGTPRKTSPYEDEVDRRFQSQSPRNDLEIVDLDNQLSNSKNVHIKSWLRKKEAAIRRQKREERKKEREKLEAEERQQSMKVQRVAESEVQYDKWVKDKKRVSQVSKRVARKVFRDTDAITRVQASNVVVEETRPISPSRANSTQTRSKVRAKKVLKEENRVKMTTHDNSIGIVKDYDGDWTDSVNCKRDLAAERERDEEKRQSKEAKKRQRQLKAKSNAEQRQKKSESKRSFPRGMSTKSSPPTNESQEEIGPQRQRTRPSSNPLKGMTYDQWLNQKLKSDQERREIKQELTDPELEDLIPLLAKHRIDRAKEPSRRVDSGLSKPTSSNSHKSESAKPSGDGNQRPYTWEGNSERKSPKANPWKSFPKGNSFLNVKTPTPPNTPLPNRTHSRKSNSSMDTDDVMNSVRPEPQGCEIPSPSSHCQTTVSQSDSDKKGTNKNNEQDNVFITETVMMP